VAALTARLVRIVACAQPALALLMVLSGGLRGGGATRPPLLVNFLGLIVIRLPLAAFLAWPPGEGLAGAAALGSLGWGVAGAWYAMAADLAVRGLAMLFIFTRLRWWTVRV
jgi:Na+-driven multidrug efflux pump